QLPRDVALVLYRKVAVARAEPRPELQAALCRPGPEPLVFLVAAVLNERRGGGLRGGGLAHAAQGGKPGYEPVHARAERGRKQVNARASVEIPAERGAFYEYAAYVQRVFGREAQAEPPADAPRLRSLAHPGLGALYEPERLALG